MSTSSKSHHNHHPVVAIPPSDIRRSLDTTVYMPFLTVVSPAHQKTRASIDDPRQALEELRRGRRRADGTPERARKIVQNAPEGMRAFLKEWSRDGGSSVEAIVEKNDQGSKDPK